MNRSILLLGTILLLHSECSNQNILGQYIVKKSQGSHDVDYPLSGIKLVTTKPSHTPEDGKYHSGDYDNVESIKSISGKPGLDYPVLDKVPETSFSCETRPEGYYADPETGCQVFHICLSQSVKNSFLCPNGSIFSQELLTCDWWNRVDCQILKNIIQNQQYGQTFARNKELPTSEKLNNIVEDIRIGEAKNKNNMVISELNDFKGSELITLRPQTVTQLTSNSVSSFTTPVVTTQQSKSNNIQSITSYLVLPVQYKCCNQSKYSNSSEPLQIQQLKLEQIRSTVASMSQYDPFFKAISDPSTLSHTDTLEQIQHSVLMHNSEPNTTKMQQQNNQNDSSRLHAFGSHTSNQTNFMTANLQYQTNVQNSVSPTTAVHILTNKASEKADDLLEHIRFREASAHLNKTLTSGQVRNSFGGLYSPPTKDSHHTTNSFELSHHTIHTTTSSVMEQPHSTLSKLERIPVSLSELLQITTSSTIQEHSHHTALGTILEQPQNITPRTILEQPQHTTPRTILEQPQHTTPRIKLERPQHTTPRTILEQRLHITPSNLEVPKNTTVSYFGLPLLTTTIRTLQVPLQVYSSGNLYSQSNHENSNYYANSADSYSSQAMPDVSIATHTQSDTSKSENECTLTKNCSHINLPSSESEVTDKKNMSLFNNTKGKSLFILDTLINPIRKEYFHESELNSSGYKKNKNDDRINIHKITDINKSTNTHSPSINRSSTPMPFRHNELLYPRTKFDQYQSLMDNSRESKQAATEREQNTQALHFKVSDILNLNNLNFAKDQHHLSEHINKYRSTIVKSISFNFDTEEGRKEYDLAVSSGLLTEV